MRYTENYSAEIERLKKELETADAVVIGAGAGLSTAAGFTYSGERLKKYFGDFVEKYGFRDMYSGGFYPFPTPEEQWAYWSRYIFINRYMDVDNGTYKRLFELVHDKDYFVITTNVDHQFQKAGFDKQRLFYTQGDYGLWQCSEPCHQKTYDNEETVRAMFAQQKDMRVPTELVPRCPVCGKPMSMNLRADETFVEDEGWHKAARRYEEFIHQHSGSHILFLELGVGMNTPGIIKYPFWKMTYADPHAVYACLNFGEACAPEEIEARSICIDADISEILKILA
ncbi:Sir2 silent information regulator family NAD-dependent deacetylase [Ruminococcus sp.]|uniref:SIR2 family NAD-dependent protein deacylase n=1 Tax=Ruminococcus sp. TaxID=41978 RepID=UPI0025F71359|nr:Sir2 silent information regulator family NAD-dependent deacetylase [Ruminococcus sp.]MBQ8967591.1 Sir2 silent information regulator family NAD-dependent deacetylase [Ruminococcus sp.]